jgi:hypothetical protein
MNQAEELLKQRPNVEDFPIQPYGYIVALTSYIDKLEQLISTEVSQQSELLIALKECRRWMINKGVNVESDFFKDIDKAINCL